MLTRPLLSFPLTYPLHSPTVMTAAPQPIVTTGRQGRLAYRLGLAPRHEALRDFALSLPQRFSRGEGEVIYRGRNELRRLTHDGHTYVAKAFRRPHLINAWAYGHLRPSKAERSLANALRLIAIGVNTPEPLAYLELRRSGLLGDSYYLSAQSECEHVFVDLFGHPFAEEEAVLREIGRVTAVMHNHGLAHLDYGRGNILFSCRSGQSPVRIELVDLNRLYAGPVGLERGCKNLERLPLTPAMRRALAESYARERGYDPRLCEERIAHYRASQPGKIEGKY